MPSPCLKASEEADGDGARPSGPVEPHVPGLRHHTTAPSRPAAGLRQQLSFAAHQQVGPAEASLSAEAALNPPTHPHKISLFPIYCTPRARPVKPHWELRSPIGRNGTASGGPRPPRPQHPSALLPTQTSLKTRPPHFAFLAITLASPRRSSTSN